MVSSRFHNSFGVSGAKPRINYPGFLFLRNALDKLNMNPAACLIAALCLVSVVCLAHGAWRGAFVAAAMALLVHSLNAWTVAQV